MARFNEYKGGKGGSDRQFWLSLWSSDPVSVDRKGGRESTFVPYPYCSVLGGIPPSMLEVLKDERGRDDGFLDRILFVYPDASAFPSQRWTETELSELSESVWARTIGRLQATPMATVDEQLRPSCVGFTEEGKRAWVAWFDLHAAEMEADTFSDRRAGTWSKMRPPCGPVRPDTVSAPDRMPSSLRLGHDQPG